MAAPSSPASVRSARPEALAVHPPMAVGAELARLAQMVPAATEALDLPGAFRGTAVAAEAATEVAPRPLAAMAVAVPPEAVVARRKMAPVAARVVTVPTMPATAATVPVAVVVAAIAAAPATPAATAAPASIGMLCMAQVAAVAVVGVLVPGVLVEPAAPAGRAGSTAAAAVAVVGETSLASAATAAVASSSLLTHRLARPPSQPMRRAGSSFLRARQLWARHGSNSQQPNITIRRPPARLLSRSDAIQVFQQNC